MALFAALLFSCLTIPKTILRPVYGICPGKRLYMSVQSYVVLVNPIAIAYIARYTRRAYMPYTFTVYPYAVNRPR